MPNHIINEIKFEGLTPEKKKAILDCATNEKGEVDFGIMVPMPLNIWWGGSNKTTDEVFGGSWYDWSIKNWGTKWNAYESSVEDGGDMLVIVFQTAWSSPHPWLAALFNKVDVPFQLIWKDEGRDDVIVEEFSINEHTGKSWQMVPATDEQIDIAYGLFYGMSKDEYDKQYLEEDTNND